MAPRIKFAPSWSWASIAGPVASVGFSSLVVATEIIDIQTVRVSANFFDGVESCRLRLRGPLCQVSRHVRSFEPWISVAQNTEFQKFGHFSFQKGRVIIIEWDIPGEQVSVNLEPQGSVTVQSTSFLLHIASEHSEDGRIERGIILQRAKVRGSYIRVGSFMFPFHSEYPGSELESAFEGRLDTLGKDDYIELDSNGRYTIDVV